MNKFVSLLTAACFVFAAGLAACASDEPRHADPPPGSHSPFADPDERGTDDRRAHEPEPEPEADPDEEETEPEEPIERN